MSNLTITAADLAPIPYIERCDYNNFLAKLAQLHGEGYLRRPDGSLLDGVVVIPTLRTAHQPKRQAPTLPDGYTGRPMADFQPQMRSIPVLEERFHDTPTGGYVCLQKDTSVKAQVLAALADGPKTLGQQPPGFSRGEYVNTGMVIPNGAEQRVSLTVVGEATAVANKRWGE